MREHIIAVDVGTGSARAGVFNLLGEQLSRVATPISINRPAALHYEQDSEEIWRAVTRSVRQARADAGIAPGEVAALGFDATCSLVFRDRQARPLGVSRTPGGRFDTILWMDHRANDEARECSVSGDPLIERFGGRLSPEMQLAKLLWMKRHLPDRWAATGAVFDLCDYLTWRATESTARSHSALASKWGYQPEAPGFYPDSFCHESGLEDLLERTGVPVFSYDTAMAIGPLSAAGAEALGLTEACIVAPGLIDAYAGTAGAYCGVASGDMARHAALIAGTSSCVVMLSRHEIRPHPGCWGGFSDVALPGHWLIEAGQSASGALLDHILRTSPAGGEPTQALHLRVLDHIATRLAETGFGYGLPISVLPDFHGTRAPVSDATLTGTIAGLDLDDSFDGLCRLYWRACVGLACGIRHILDEMPGGAGVDTLLMAGGFASHRLIPELYASITGRAVLVNEARDAVLSGTAVHAGLAAGLYPDREEAAVFFSRPGRMVAPNPALREAAERDYRIYLAMVRHRAELRELAAPAPVSMEA